VRHAEERGGAVMTVTRRGFLRTGAAAAALAITPVRARAQGRGPIKIGAFGPLSGNAAAQGQSLRESIEMVVKMRNATGGIGGRQIELLLGDDAGKPEEAAVVARRFATRDNVCVALGSVSSPASLAAAQVFREEQLPQIVVTGTAQRITTQGNEWVFRSAVPDRKLVSDMVDFVNEKMPAIKRFGFLFVNDDFGKGAFDAFGEACKKYGMTIVAEERYTRGDLDFTGQLTRIRSTNPQALVDWSRYTEGALIQRQLRQMGWELPRFGSDGIGAPAFLELAKEAANGIIYPTPFSPATSTNLPEAQKFIALVRSTYNKPPDFVHAQAFDAINIAIAAVERAGSSERTAVRDAIRQTNFQSVRGPFRFDAKGDPTLVTHMVRIVDVKETNARG
jgi:branched-chain amino acid transport system substrate-binding protein